MYRTLVDKLHLATAGLKASIQFVCEHFVSLYRVSHKKGIDKKLLFGADQGFNSQFLMLFGFSVSVSFVWCII